MLEQVIRQTQRLLQKLFLGLIQIYQYCFSPLFGNRCRFYPSCSNYAKAAIKQYGAIKGVWLAIKRIMRCHPFQAGGYDPVPKKQK